MKVPNIKVTIHHVIKDTKKDVVSKETLSDYYKYLKGMQN